MPKVRSKAKSKTKAAIPRYRGKRPSLFGPPLLLLGEDAAEYDELHAGIRATLNPIDTLDEMFVADVVYSAWAILRWRRQKSSLIRGYQIKALEKFLTEKLHYSLYVQDFAVELASTLQNILPEDQAHTAQQLADACARDERGANNRVEKILNGRNLVPAKCGLYIP